MKLDFLSPHDTAIWDDFVEKSPQGSIFSTTAFLEGLNVKYRVGILADKGKIKAGIVLARNELGAFSNPLLVKYLGILLAPASHDAKYVTSFGKESNLIHELVGSLRPYHSFDYTFHPQFTNWLPFYWAGYRQETRYTYVFDNLQNIEYLINDAAPRVRRNLTKAESNDICVQYHLALDDFFRVNSLTFERQGAPPPYSKEKLRVLHERLSATGQIHLLGAFNQSGDLVSVNGVVNDQRCAYLLFNGSDYRFADTGANTKLVIETLKFCSKFVSKFDFEGSMIRDIEFFYRSFGAVQTPFFSIWRDNMLVRNKRKLVNIYKKIKYRK